MRKATKLAALLGAGALVFNVATTSVMAGPFGGQIALGVAGTVGEATTTGEESLKTTAVKTSKTHKNVGGYTSYWAQYTFGEDGFVIGYEKNAKDIPLGNGLRQLTGAAETDEVDMGDQVVAASIGNLTTWYIESPGLGFDGIFGGNGGLFVKYAHSNATLKTEENLASGSSYGDADVSSDTYGIGFKTGTAGGLMFKASYDVTEFSSVSIGSTGSDAVTTITSPGTEVDSIKVSVGFAF